MADWVIRLIEHSGYWGVALLMFLETVFPPVPSEVIMPIAGVSAAAGHMSLAGVIASGTFGAMAGNFFWYLVARWVGLFRFRAFIEKRGRWLTMDWYDVERVERLFGRFGAIIVGIDVIGGEWLTEINVTSPTGIVAIDRFNGTDTPALIWDAIEAKLG